MHPSLHSLFLQQFPIISNCAKGKFYYITLSWLVNHQPTFEVITCNGKGMKIIKVHYIKTYKNSFKLIKRDNTLESLYRKFYENTYKFGYMLTLRNRIV